MSEPSPPEPVFNPNARVAMRRLGRELQPLVVVDDVLLNPDDMRAFALAQAYDAPPQGSYYPGRNGRLPPEYGTRLTLTLRPLLERVFGLPAFEALAHKGFFGVATTKPGDLQPLQAIPHFDSLDPKGIATVHYFCGEPYRGTAFFRHEATGFETIDARRVDAYRAKVFAEMETLGEGSLAHVGRDMPFFTEIDYVEAVYNRLAIYRTTSLHAGILGETPLLDGASEGRLTANGFIDIHRG